MTNQANLGGRFTFPGTNLSVNRMGYGAMQLAGPHVFGPPRDPDGAVAVLKAAATAGVDHIDTSDFYGPHVTNQLIKRALHPYPKNLVIVTKVGARRGGDASWLPAQSPDELRTAVDDNLRNLGVDSLDVVNLRVGLMTFVDESIEERVRVLVDLKRRGLIKYIGLSNVTAKQFAEARASTEIVCVQNQYNLAHRADDAFIDQLAKDGHAGEDRLGQHLEGVDSPFVRQDRATHRGTGLQVDPVPGQLRRAQRSGRLDGGRVQ